MEIKCLSLKVMEHDGHCTKYIQQLFFVLFCFVFFSLNGKSMRES